MVSAQNQGQKSFSKRLLDRPRNVLAGFCNLLQILRALFADRHFFWLLHFQVADVLDGVPKLPDRRLQSRTAQRRGTHVDTAAALAQVHGHTNDSHFLRHVFCPDSVAKPLRTCQPALPTLAACPSPPLLTAVET